MAKILVIDDSETICEMLNVVLSSFQYEVVTLKKEPDYTQIENLNPQVVLLDVLLWDISGKEICRKIKEIKPALPVILMSANSQVLTDFTCCKADDIIEKPFDIKSLKTKIETLLEKVCS